MHKIIAFCTGVTSTRRTLMVGRHFTAPPLATISQCAASL